MDLLYYLEPIQRQGFIARLATGYYEGWRPTRYELADQIAVELGILSWEESVYRSRRRQGGQEPETITPALRAHYRERQQQRQPSGR